MSNFLQHVKETAQCPHGGKISIVSTNVRVKVSGNFVALQPDNFMVAGCPFTLPGPKPSPCIKVQWTVAATRVKVTGKPVLLKTNIGLCQNAEQAPQGPANIAVTQTRVKGL